MCISLFLLTQLLCTNLLTAADIQEKARKDLQIFIIAHFFHTIPEARFSLYTQRIQ